jgi:hypothetical protein
MTESAATRHLLAAEKALQRARRSMELAEQKSPEIDLGVAWRGYEELSLGLQAERMQQEDRDDA